MTLSEDDQGTLDQIESCTRLADPVFAAILDFPAAQRRRRQRVLLTQCAFCIGTVILIFGAGAANGMISLGTFVGFYGFAIILWATVTALRDWSPRCRLYRAWLRCPGSQPETHSPHDDRSHDEQGP